MKKVIVLGPGCAKCVKLAENVTEAVKTLGIDCDVEKVTDIEKIVSYGVMMTPGLVIDGKLVSTGRLLTVKEIQNLLSS